MVAFVCLFALVCVCVCVVTLVISSLLPRPTPLPNGACMAHRWGAGVRGPLSPDDETLARRVKSPSAWHLDDVGREDVSQADIAPLMSALLGTVV